VSKKLLRCSICQLPIEPEPGGWVGGNNAAPINDGRCCNDCNARVVLPARMNLMKMTAELTSK
jgi:hypothetical protein